MSEPAAGPTDEQAARERAVTDAVVASFDGSTDDRYREVMTSLVEHLHGFARDVRLSEAEWTQAIAFLRPAATSRPRPGRSSSCCPTSWGCRC